MNFGIGRQIDGEAVANGLTMRLASKAEHREGLVVIVWLNDISNVPKCLLILVQLVTDEVKRILVARVAVTRSIVNACNKADLPASTKVVDE